jgi:hypothetical protein
MNHHADSARRLLLRGALVATATTGLVLAASPSFADTPAAWAEPPHVSGLQFLVVLFLIPLGLFVVISLLAVLPSLIKGDTGATADSWRGEGEWIGGPRRGVEATDDAPELTGSDSQTGGASAQW